ncbi:protein mono-ADP-ribosyltransferase PARP11-like isoform X2 [Gasterosteus aculeatus]
MSTNRHLSKSHRGSPVLLKGNSFVWVFIFGLTMWCHDEEEPMDTSETPLFWYYLADCGRWHRFEDDPDSPLKTSLRTDSIGGKTSVQRGYNIERSCSCFSAAPVLWEKVDPACPYQLIPLNELSIEYQNVAHYVKTEGLLDRSTVSISRIQNMDLWEMYCRKNKQLMRIHGKMQEKRLFHGTEIRNVHSICTHNFDLGLSRVGTYGRGIYFAKHATYADRYANRSTDPLPFYDGEERGLEGQRTKVIFLARVIIGKSTVGHPLFRKPDGGSSINSYNSCVDDSSNPKIFVIFDPNQIYPEYLIQYK